MIGVAVEAKARQTALALQRVARLSSRWAHAVRESPVLPGLNRHWPDTLANGAMAHMSTLLFFGDSDRLHLDVR
jgi:hypothetical protein